MHPLITQVLNSTSKRCAEKVVDLTGYGGKLHVNDILPDIRESNLDILAAVRDLAEGMKKEMVKHDCDLAVCTHYLDVICHNRALTDLITALSEGKESV